nr:peroxidase 64 [Ipomoea batatas]
MLIVGEDEDCGGEINDGDGDQFLDGDPPTEVAHLSLLDLPLTAMGGIDGPKTMKFRGQIAGLDILIMVDSGASHNFISRQLTAVLQHPLEPTTTFGVRLGDGRRAESDGKYSQLHVDLGPIAMPIDCFAFPLGGVDLILGIAWLETLGDVKANWAKLTMEFTIGDIPVQLVGDPSLARLPISLSSLDKIEDTAYCCSTTIFSGNPKAYRLSERMTTGLPCKQVLLQ